MPRRWIANHHLRGLSYGLADMPTEMGQSPRWEVDPLTTRVTIRLVEGIASLPAYRALSTILPEDKVALYFERRISDDVYPALIALYVAQWHSENGRYQGPHEVLWDDHQGLGSALQMVWPSSDIPLKLGASRSINTIGRSMLRPLYKSSRSLALKLRQALLRGEYGEFPAAAGPTVAVHYGLGIDLTRRSDLFWYPSSRVEPHRILIYFDGVYAGEGIPPDTLMEIEGRRLNWVWLKGGALGRKHFPVWIPHSDAQSLQARYVRQRGRPKDATEHWVAREAERLLREVDYWVAFYRRFNVKVHVDVEEGGGRQVAQNIALDLTGGLRLSWQRSEPAVAEGSELGFRPNHVYLTWNERGVHDDELNRNRTSIVVVSGYPYDGAKSADATSMRPRTKLAAAGARFVVALFDNMVMPDYGAYSRAMVRAFYTAFLQWTLDDPHVAVLTKSKRPAVLQQLPEIRELMATAEATGRWVNLTDVVGRLPSDASRAADISVGIGISSAVSEAVAVGGKGVHCDLPAMRSHPFYEWGYEKVVFDDLDCMMAALKRYKADPGSEPELGDFASRMDQVDPFHDGRSGERVGSYLRWLLEAFDGGLDRDTAIRRANEQYAGSWGADKILRPKLRGIEDEARLLEGDKTLSR